MQDAGQAEAVVGTPSGGGSWLVRQLMRHGWWAAPLLLVVLGVAAYAPAPWGVFVFDDRSHIYESVRLRQLWPLDQYIGRRGLLDFTLTLHHLIDGVKPRGYHIVNVVIHLLAGLTLFGLMRRLLSLGQWPGRVRACAMGLAWFIAALWMVHPLQTQAVTYVIQRGESMMGLFVLLATYGVVRMAQGRARVWLWGLAAAGSMLLAVWTKESAVVMPLAIVLLDVSVLGLSWRRTARERWWVYGAMLAVAALPLFGNLGELNINPVSSGVTAAAAERAAGEADGESKADGGSEAEAESVTPSGVSSDVPPVVSSVMSRPEHVVPSVMSLAEYPTAGFGMPHMTWRQYFFTQPAVIVWYLKQAFWPSWLTIEYNWRPMTTPWGGRRALDLQLAFGLLMLLAGLTLWSLWRLPWLGAAGSWFFLSLAVTSSFIPINDVAVEHRMYLAMVSVVSVTVIGAWWVVDRLCQCRQRDAASEAGVRDEAGAAASVSFSDEDEVADGEARGDVSRRRRVGMKLLVAAGCVAVAAAGARTFVRNLDYRSELAIWESAAAGQVPNARILKNMGSSLYEAGRREEAEALYREALRDKPSDASLLLNMGNVHFNRRNEDPSALDEAQRYYRQALVMYPQSLQAMIYLSRIHMMRGELPEALALLEKATAAHPDSLLAFKSLAMCQYRLKMYDEALRSYERVEAITGPSAEGLTNRGMVLVAKGDFDGGVALLRRAVALEPGFAPGWDQLAQTLARQGQFVEAERALRRAMAAEPSMLRSRQLAMLLAHCPDPQVRDIEQAVGIVQQGLMVTGHRDAAWLEVGAKVALAAGRADQALLLERQAYALAASRGAPQEVLRQGAEEIKRLEGLVDAMQRGHSTEP